MVTYSELCDIAESSDILMLSGKLHNAPSMAICDDGDCTIIFDYSKIDNTESRMVCTAHEIGHCETGSFYTPKSLELRERMEYRANKWAIKKLIPKNELEQAIKEGNEEIWQLAEYFDITEDMVRFAYWVYFDIEI